MPQVNLRKAAIIGCGFVGSASAFALMQSGLFSELVLIDANKEKAEGVVLSMPAIVGKNGRGAYVPIRLSEKEHAALRQSAATLKAVAAQEI